MIKSETKPSIAQMIDDLKAYNVFWKGGRDGN